MPAYRRMITAILGALVVTAIAVSPSLADEVKAAGTGTAAPANQEHAAGSVASAPDHHVVGNAEIEARIDAKVSREDADRQVIQGLLARPEVRELASAAGLDLQRAQRAAAVLSGNQLEELASRARSVNGAFGGSERVTLTYTAVIIILLVIIILILI